MSNRDDYSETEESAEFEAPRPNRWHGPSSTWFTLTEQERGLAASLDKLRSRDLSIHLYNAHAMKRRAKELKHKKPEHTGVLQHPPDAEEVDRAFTPPKSWTAWPLPPDEVPREGELIGPDDPNEAFTFKVRQRVMPSRPLEENLLAVTLRFAKERFEAREWDDRSLDEDERRVEERQSSLSAEDADSMGRTSNRNAPQHSDPEDENTAQSPTNIKNRRSESAPRLPSSIPDISKVRIKVGTPNPQLAEKYMKPVVSADDERSFELLRPSIRCTLSKLDDALMALHHARQACFDVANQSEHSTEDDTEKQPPLGQKRSRGRPRNAENLPELLREVDAELEYTDNSNLWRPKKSRTGRPKKQYEHLEGETQEEYLIRVARIQKKALPAFAPPRDTETAESSQQEESRGRPTKRPKKRATPQARRSRRRIELGTRDWSDVVGIAAIVGFSPEVVARAAQRCATLFGENMILNTMIEAPFNAKDSDYATLYQPETIPEFEPMASDSPEADGDGSDSSDKTTDTRGRNITRKPPSSRTHLHSWFCPIDGCEMQRRGLRYMSHLKRHLRKVHKLSNDKVQAYFPASDEEMDGAVHADGFMRPIKNKTGVRGKDLVMRKKRGSASRSRTRSGSGVDEDEQESQDNGRMERVADVEVEVASRASSGSP